MDANTGPWRALFCSRIKPVSRSWKTLADFSNRYPRQIMHLATSRMCPNSVESLLEMIQRMIAKYDSNAKFGQNQEDDSSFIESLNCI